MPIHYFADGSSCECDEIEHYEDEETDSSLAYDIAYPSQIMIKYYSNYCETHKDIRAYKIFPPIGPSGHREGIRLELFRSGAVYRMFSENKRGFYGADREYNEDGNLSIERFFIKGVSSMLWAVDAFHRPTENCPTENFL